MQHKFLAIPALAAAAALALTLAGCSTDTSARASDATSGPVTVVASTNVYGDIARQVGGDLVSVTSIIDDPDKDPHEYEADARNQLSLSKARIVIENGAGYDDFIDTMLKSAGANEATVLNAADLSGYDQKPADGEFNEHLWYDFPTIEKLTASLVGALSKAQPASAETFAANGKAFTAKLAVLEATEASLKAKYAGTGAAITEPVPLYLLDAMGLENKTPEKFSEAIEADTDVAPSVLKATLGLYSSHAVAVLAYNAQTTGAQTEAVLKAAQKNDIPVVAVTETMPAGKNYISWMTANLDALSAALGK